MNLLVKAIDFDIQTLKIITGVDKIDLMNKIIQAQKISRKASKQARYLYDQLIELGNTR